MGKREIGKKSNLKKYKMEKEKLARVETCKNRNL